MNTFQQQYLSVLGAVTGRKFLQAADTVIDNANANVPISKDKTLMKDMTGEVNESIGKQKYSKHFANMTAQAIDKDPMSEDAETLVEVNSVLNAQQRQIQELQRGLDAEKASKQALQNKIAAKQHKMTDNQFQKEFNKRAKPITHGGKQ